MTDSMPLRGCLCSCLTLVARVEYVSDATDAPRRIHQPDKYHGH